MSEGDASAEAPAPAGAWGVVFACFVCQLGLGYAYLFSPLLSEATRDLGWTRAEFAAARWPYFLVLGGASALLGHASVRFGARAILMGSAACLGAAFWLLARMQHLSELYLANLLYGLFMAGLGDVVVAGVLVRHVHRRRGLALGIALAASNVGGMLLPPLFAALTDAWGWREALRVLALGGSVALLPFAWWAGRAAPQAPAAPGPRPGAASPGHEAALGLRDALGTRSFWLLAGALAGYFFFFLGMNDSFVALLTDAGMSRLEAAGLYAAAVGAGGLSKVGVGLVADRMPPRAGLAVDFALLLLASACLPFLPDRAVLVIFLVSYGLAVAARDVVYPLAVAACFGERTMPRLYGAMMLGLMVAGPLGSVVTQAVHDRTGSYQPAYLGYVIMNAVVLVSLAWVRRETDRI